MVDLAFTQLIRSHTRAPIAAKTTHGGSDASIDRRRAAACDPTAPSNANNKNRSSMCGKWSHADFDRLLHSSIAVSWVLEVSPTFISVASSSSLSSPLPSAYELVSRDCAASKNRLLSPVDGISRAPPRLRSQAVSSLTEIPWR